MKKLWQEWFRLFLWFFSIPLFVYSTIPCIFRSSSFLITSHEWDYYFLWRASVSFYFAVWICMSIFSCISYFLSNFFKLFFWLFFTQYISKITLSNFYFIPEFNSFTFFSLTVLFINFIVSYKSVLYLVNFLHLLSIYNHCFILVDPPLFLSSYSFYCV